MYHMSKKFKKFSTIMSSTMLIKQGLQYVQEVFDHHVFHNSYQTGYKRMDALHNAFRTTTLLSGKKLSNRHPSNLLLIAIYC